MILTPGDYSHPWRLFSPLWTLLKHADYFHTQRLLSGTFLIHVIILIYVNSSSPWKLLSPMRLFSTPGDYYHHYSHPWGLFLHLGTIGKIIYLNNFSTFTSSQSMSFVALLLCAVSMIILVPIFSRIAQKLREIWPKM